MVGRRVGRSCRNTQQHIDPSAKPASSQGGGFKEQSAQRKVFQPGRVVGVGSAARSINGGPERRLDG